MSCYYPTITNASLHIHEIQISFSRLVDYINFVIVVVKMQVKFIKYFCLFPWCQLTPVWKKKWVNNYFELLHPKPYSEIMQCKNDIYHPLRLLFDKYNTKFGSRQPQLSNFLVQEIYVYKLYNWLYDWSR